MEVEEGRQASCVILKTTKIAKRSNIWNLNIFYVNYKEGILTLLLSYKLSRNLGNIALLLIVLMHRDPERSDMDFKA